MVIQVAYLKCKHNASDSLSLINMDIYNVGTCNRCSNNNKDIYLLFPISISVF